MPIKNKLICASFEEVSLFILDCNSQEIQIKEILVKYEGNSNCLMAFKLDNSLYEQKNFWCLLLGCIKGFIRYPETVLKFLLYRSYKIPKELVLNLTNKFGTKYLDIRVKLIERLRICALFSVGCK